MYDPYIGLAVEAPGFFNSSFEQYERSVDLAYKIEEELPLWSRNYPELQFVFVIWKTLQVTFELEGYVCQNGNRSEQISGPNAKRELLGNLGVVLGRKGYFPPLTHPFYDDIKPMDQA